MAHHVVSAITDVAIQPGAVVSKVIHKDDTLNVTVFGFDKGEGLTEHTANRAAVVQVLSGQLQFNVEGESIDLAPGQWLYMTQGAPHTLEALEPTIMILTLISC